MTSTITPAFDRLSWRAGLNYRNMKREMEWSVRQSGTESLVTELLAKFLAWVEMIDNAG